MFLYIMVHHNPSGKFFKKLIVLDMYIMMDLSVFVQK